MKTNWWKKATIYQIYPRSFQDTNDDGIGDLQGIIQHLDYLEFLGIDAVWLSPIYQSPNEDNGYDISDYQVINPEYGTMNDVETLIKKAKKRNIRIIMDLVVNHTSSEHPWFQSAVHDPKSEFHNFYIWRKSYDEKPPNDLQSNFGGSAWTYVPDLGEYYFHLHAKEQPDLNWENPSMRQEIYRMMNFWIEKGVGGFRLDVIDLIGKEPDQSITKNGPKLHELLQEMNRCTFGNYDLVTVGETWGATPEIAQLYSNESRDELSMVFQFEHINLDKQVGKRKWDLKELDPKELHQVFSKWQTELADKGWNSLFWNNHDLPRIISRWGNDQEYRVLSGKMLAIYLYFLQGTPYLYQGEEIGMINYPVESIDEVNDIESRRMYDERINSGYTKEEIIASINVKGRDNGRHPMHWDDSKQAGFTTSIPWLPVGDSSEINVATALEDQTSLFYTYKKLIQFRKKFPVITEGSFESISTGDTAILAYIRRYKEETLLVVVNFSNESDHFLLDSTQQIKEILIHNYEKEISQTLLPYESYAVLLK
ncbi:glycoside hydrolase family 13 protein [Enterococcus pingfangensis]|uniref:glycoside hydrolase family 13 protein n=1 Tax=Enterococcus pingfangensis TaxID=2559924 RepID=UPI00148565EF|nr:alpha-glucosidase [Enterococcus pingfangensis]